jgi:hypothetical protein
MSVIGAVGMFSTSIWQPFIGRWIDNNTAAGAAKGLTGNELDLWAGQQTLGTMVMFPASLIVLFIVLMFWVKKNKNNQGTPTGAKSPEYARAH